MNDNEIAVELVKAALMAPPAREWGYIQKLERSNAKNTTYEKKGALSLPVNKFQIPDRWLKQMGLVDQVITLKDTDGTSVDRFIKTRFKLRPFIGESKFIGRIVFWLPDLSAMKEFMELLEIREYSIVELLNGRTVYEKKKDQL